MDTRFLQANKEARWAFGLTLAYLVGWVITAYLPGNIPGISGLPAWFEAACIALPLLFIVLCWLMVRMIFRDISLEDDNAN
ncbi:DUF997 family protein [Yersinia canariae]|uniref:DUF997 family protein n=1 Tax=Yersinia canariae TaxID=2607663 RepID=A0A857F5H6_9GAMM|nr:YhdT family protein [Yersinia canariae]QHB34165.1 DUF997 family protein [Yersinia canariae]